MDPESGTVERNHTIEACIRKAKRQEGKIGPLGDNDDVSGTATTLTQQPRFDVLPLGPSNLIEPCFFGYVTRS
jgi:hypothetical protein